MRLIDADALLEQVIRLRYILGQPPNSQELVYAIENAPTIDAVSIVRCEDCKYSRFFYSDDGEDLYDCVKDTFACRLAVKPDWFCPDGEKEEE